MIAEGARVTLDLIGELFGQDLGAQEAETLVVGREVGRDVDLILREAADQLAYDRGAEPLATFPLDRDDGGELVRVLVWLDAPEGDDLAVAAEGDELLRLELFGVEALSFDRLPNERHIGGGGGREIEI